MKSKDTIKKKNRIKNNSSKKKKSQINHKIKKKNRIKNNSSKKKKNIKIFSKYSKKTRKYKKKLNKINMSGGGIPFGGTLKGMLGLTHNEENGRENMVDNLCEINSVRPTQDMNLSGILSQMCDLNTNLKKNKKGNDGLVKGALRLIGTFATLPLRTASSVVKNVTGFNPSEAVYNSIKNSINKEEENNQIIQQKTHIQGVVQPLGNVHATHMQGGVQPLGNVHATHMQGGVQPLGNIKVHPQIHTGKQLNVGM